MNNTKGNRFFDLESGSEMLAVRLLGNIGLSFTKAATAGTIMLGAMPILVEIQLILTFLVINVSAARPHGPSIAGSTG